MNKYFTITAFLIGLFFNSCNSTISDNATDKQLKTEVEFNEQKLPSLTETSAKISTEINNDPVKLVEVIFDAAKSGNFSQLSELCDPSGSGDGDTKSICNIASQPKQTQEEFKNYFQKGKIIGSAVINGNTAKVKIKFGPDGNRNEEFNLVKVENKWYISSF